MCEGLACEAQEEIEESAMHREQTREVCPFGLQQARSVHTAEPKASHSYKFLLRVECLFSRVTEYVTCHFSRAGIWYC